MIKLDKDKKINKRCLFQTDNISSVELLLRHTNILNDTYLP